MIYVWLSSIKSFALHWRHNGRDGVSNQQPYDCLLSRLFRRRSNLTSKLRVTVLCEGNSTGPVNSPHKWPITRKIFAFADVIMWIIHAWYRWDRTYRKPAISMLFWSCQAWDQTECTYNPCSDQTTCWRHMYLSQCRCFYFYFNKIDLLPFALMRGATGPLI